ncbi:MAG TPA: cytochrome d ubiquinol oxidase subunit II [Vicinamibacterales bacterium]|nr:cytochrome d ubiquinol oxidase subunit II [Vicinamibacterales bacterium]
MIHELWFIVLAFMLAGYAVLDGFDLGVGALHLFVGRDATERGHAIDSIGPVWNGNEVWLLAAGGSMIVAFPHVYAASFSGFYLALMLVLWLLLLRGISIEFRHQVASRLWHEIWDVVFFLASALLAVLFGVAVGNVLRGVPLDARGEFQGSFALMLNPFAVLGGLLSLATLSLHGATWLGLKTGGPVQLRARRAVGPLWWATIALLVAMVAASFMVRPGFAQNFLRWPVLFVFPVLAVWAAAYMRRAWTRDNARGAFVGSAGLIAGVLASVAAGLFPRLLPALSGSPHPGLDIYNASSPPGSMRIALWIYVFGMALVILYLVNIYRIWKGRTQAYHI